MNKENKMMSDCTLKIRDHQGREISEPLRSQSVKVWEIEPHRSSGYTHCLVMGWQDMHEELANIAVDKLERMPECDLAEGLTIKVRLIDMVYGDYLDEINN